MNKVITPIIAFSLFSFSLLPAYAANNFNVTRTAGGGQSFVDSFDRFEDIFDSVKQEGFDNITGYTPTSAATGVLDIRGVEATVNYALNSTTLSLDVPSIGVSKTFTGETREQSEDLFEAYIENNGDNILTKMLQQMVSETAIDPVAGNPNSLMSTMALADFNSAFSMASKPGQKTATDPNKKVEKNKLEAGLEVGHFSSKGVDKNLLSLPLSYTHYFEDPRKQLRLSSPISYVETNKSKSYKVSFGASLNYPVNEKWSLTPAVRVGLLGSQDLGSAAAIYSGSLTSLYQFPYNDMNIMVGNMVNVMSTADIKLDDYEIGYDLSNQIMKNGISIEKPVGYKVLGKMASTEFSIANTQFFGDSLFIENYTDLAVSIGTRKRVGGSSATDDALHVGVTYSIGDHGYKGGKLNFGYKF